MSSISSSDCCFFSSCCFSASSLFVPVKTIPTSSSFFPVFVVLPFSLVVLLLSNSLFFPNYFFVSLCFRSILSFFSVWSSSSALCFYSLSTFFPFYSVCFSIYAINPLFLFLLSLSLSFSLLAAFSFLSSLLLLICLSWSSMRLLCKPLSR